MLKRMLCCFLVVLMLMSLCACDNKTKTEDNTTSTVDVSDNTEVVDLQKFYTNYFASEKLRFAGDSIEMSNDKMNIKMINAKDGKNLFSFGNDKNCFELYQDTDGKEYIHVLINQITKQENVETEEIDSWYYLDTVKIQNTATFEDLFKDFAIDFTMFQGTNIRNIKYLRTENNIDYISAKLNTSEFENVYDATIYELRFDYHEKPLSLEYIIFPDEADNGYPFKEIETEIFDVLKYNVDLVNEQFVHKETNEIIPFTIVSEKKGSEVAFVDVEIMANSETNEVLSISGIIEEMKTDIKFIEQENIKFKVSDTVEKCDEETLSMLLMTVVFSMAM